MQHNAALRIHASNNLDLLRLIFATLVLLGHSYELVTGDRSREPLTRVFHTISLGELAVDFFFILSGFLITMSWDREPRWEHFLRKRILRIYPGFIVAFLISVLVVGSIGAADAGAYLLALHPVRLLMQLVLLAAPETPPTFSDWPYPVVNGAMWTIHYEFGCYLLALVLGLVGLTRRVAPLTLLWAATLTLFLLFRLHRLGDATTGAVAGNMASWLRFVPMFLSGAVIYRSGLHAVRPVWAIVAAAALLIAGMSFKGTAEVAVATAGAYLIFVIGLSPKRLLPGRPPDISYGVYLYGWPVQKLAIAWKITQPLLVFGVTFSACIALGLLSWYLIEAPALRLRPKQQSQQTGQPVLYLSRRLRSPKF